MKNKKIYIMLVVSILLTVIGVSLAYFSLNIIGNDTAKYNTITTGDLALTYTDTSELSFDNALPGDSITKTIIVKNTGTEEVSYNLTWQELINTIINNELVIEGTCKRLNSSGTEEGTCKSIAQTPIKSNVIKKNISIEPNITHEYTIKVTFLDTGEPQNYNKNKSFTGKLGVEEYIPTQFEKDNWTTIATNVRNGNIGNYKVGDTREIDMGSYGTHTLRIANTSTPSECSTTGFSQSACGFVIEFADIITTHSMNDGKTNVGGWPASEMYAFINNDIYNVLPNDLKNNIISTVTVSGHGYDDNNNFTSTDKLYLFSPKEVYSNWTGSYETAKDLNRTLDYYTAQGITTTSYNGAIKNSGTTATAWWLRSGNNSTNNGFYSVRDDGSSGTTLSTALRGVSPAFRIG